MRVPGAARTKRGGPHKQPQYQPGSAGATAPRATEAFYAGGDAIRASPLKGSRAVGTDRRLEGS